MSDGTYLIILETAHPRFTQVLTIRMAGEERLRKRKNTLNYLLLVHGCLSGPDFGFDQGYDSGEKEIVFGSLDD
jgi:hypothetical protein